MTQVTVVNEVTQVSINNGRVQVLTVGVQGPGAGATDLDSLRNVDTTGKADGDALVWDEGAEKWVPGAGGGGGGAETLDELSDVAITTPASGQVLRHNGSGWVNAAIQDADLPATIARDSEVAAAVAVVQADVDAHEANTSNPHSTTAAQVGAPALALLTALGALPYASGASTWVALAGNTTTTRKFLRQVGDGSASAAPAWDTLQDADIPATIARDSEVTAAVAVAQAAADAAQADIDDHLADGSDAHDASAISFSPTGGLGSTDVQAALAELDTEKAAAAHTHALDDLSDVAITTPAARHILAYDSGDSRWENRPMEAADLPTVPANKLDGLTGGLTAGRYLRAVDSDTLEERTPAQVLGDIGAAAASHTHAQSDVTDLVTDLAAKTAIGAGGIWFPIATAAQSISSISNGIRINTEIPTSALADGVYVLDLDICATSISRKYQYSIEFRVASGALAVDQVPFFTVDGCHTDYGAVRVDAVSSKFVVKIAMPTGRAYAVQCVVKSAVATASYFTGWTLSDVAPTGGTLATESNAKGPLLCTTLTGTGAQTGFTTGNFSSNLTVGGDHIFSATNAVMRKSANGTSLTINGGNGSADSNGSNIILYGGTHASQADGLHLRAGTTSGTGYVALIANATICFRVNHDKTVTLDSTTASSLKAALPFRGVSAYKTTDQTGIAATTYTKVTFGSEESDPQSSFASSTFTAPVAGRYSIRLNAQSSSSAAAGHYYNVYKNGARITTINSKGGVTSATGQVLFTAAEWTLTLAANDTIEIYAYFTGGTSAIYAVGIGSDTGVTSLVIDFLGT